MWGWIAMNNMYPTYHNTWDLHVLWEIECNIYKGLDFCRKRTYKFRFCRGDKCLTFIRVWTFVERVRPTKESTLERVYIIMLHSISHSSVWVTRYICRVHHIPAHTSKSTYVWLVKPYKWFYCVFIYIFWGLIQQITL